MKIMNIMVVDDSIVFRSGINQALEDVENINVVKSASNGKIALEFLQQNSEIDLITLDLEMPVMDGISAIKEIRKFNQTVKIIVFSATSVHGAEATIEALSIGANDFVTKVQSSKVGASEGIKLIKENLVPKIKALLNMNGSSRCSTPILNTKDRQNEKNKSPLDQGSKTEQIGETYSSENFFSEMPTKPKLIVIGSSTGGPDALRHIFAELKVKPTVPILIVQHMPPIFTEKLAKSLSLESIATVKEAKDGDTIIAGEAYIAPGDYHMYLDKEHKIYMGQEDKECFVRPCVNKLFESVANNFKNQILTIVLTGMGEDGARGAEILKNKNSYLYIQDKETSAIWGMPGSVYKKDIGALSLPLNKISKLIDAVSQRN